MNRIAVEKGDELILLFLFGFDEFIQSFLFGGGDAIGEFTLLQFVEFDRKGDEGFFLSSQFCSLFGLFAAGGVRRYSLSSSTLRRSRTCWASRMRSCLSSRSARLR